MVESHLASCELWEIAGDRNNAAWSGLRYSPRALASKSNVTSQGDSKVGSHLINNKIIEDVKVEEGDDFSQDTKKWKWRRIDNVCIKNYFIWYGWRTVNSSYVWFWCRDFHTNPRITNFQGIKIKQAILDPMALLNITEICLMAQNMLRHCAGLEANTMLTPYRTVRVKDGPVVYGCTACPAIFSRKVSLCASELDVFCHYMSMSSRNFQEW